MCRFQVVELIQQILRSGRLKMFSIAISMRVELCTVIVYLTVEKVNLIEINLNLKVVYIAVKRSAVNHIE